MVLAACSDGSDDDAIVPSTAEAAVTTSTAARPAPTSTTSITSTTTSAPATSTTAATSVPDDDSAELDNVDADVLAGVERAIQGERQAYLAALAEGGDKDGSEIAPYVTSERHLALVDFVQQRERDGLATKLGQLESIRVQSVQVLNGRRALATACILTDSVIYRTSTGEVIDDSVSYVLAEYELTKLDDVWTTSNGRVLASGGEETACSA